MIWSPRWPWTKRQDPQPERLRRRIGFIGGDLIRNDYDTLNVPIIDRRPNQLDFEVDFEQVRNNTNRRGIE